MSDLLGIHCYFIVLVEAIKMFIKMCLQLPTLKIFGELWRQLSLLIPGLMILTYRQPEKNMMVQDLEIFKYLGWYLGVGHTLVPVIQRNFSRSMRFIMAIEILWGFKVMLFIYFNKSKVSQRIQADPGEWNAGFSQPWAQTQKKTFSTSIFPWVGSRLKLWFLLDSVRNFCSLGSLSVFGMSFMEGTPRFFDVPKSLVCQP